MSLNTGMYPKYYCDGGRFKIVKKMNKEGGLLWQLAFDAWSFLSKSFSGNTLMSVQRYLYSYDLTDAMDGKFNF